MGLMDWLLATRREKSKTKERTEFLGSIETVNELRKAADQGYAIAQYNLGFMYFQGEGVPQDYSQAIAWYRKAIDQGYADAQYDLGFMYFKGLCVPQDYSQAVALFHKAADHGYVIAQFMLGLMYGKGEGVPQDYSQAYMWLNLAATAGSVDARNARNGLSKQLTTSQIEKGQNLTREWIAQHPQAHITQ